MADRGSNLSGVQHFKDFIRQPLHPIRYFPLHTDFAKLIAVCHTGIELKAVQIVSSIDQFFHCHGRPVIAVKMQF